jgi:hypothetical protein
MTSNYAERRRMAKKRGFESLHHERDCRELYKWAVGRLPPSGWKFTDYEVWARETGLGKT